MEKLNGNQISDLKKLAIAFEVEKYLDVENGTFTGHYPILDSDDDVIGIAGTDGDYRLTGRMSWSQMQYPAFPGEKFKFDEKNECYRMV